MEHWEEDGQDHLGDIFAKFVTIFERPYCEFGSKYTRALKKKAEASSGIRKILDAIDEKVRICSDSNYN